MLSFQWRKGIKRADRANGTDVFVTGEIFESDPNGSERKEWESLFEEGQVPQPLSADEKRTWFDEIRGKVSLSSDAFFPFPDNVWRARRSGVGHFAAPSGSVMDEKVIETANEDDAVYVFTDLRCVCTFLCPYVWSRPDGTDFVPAQPLHPLERKKKLLSFQSSSPSRFPLIYRKEVCSKVQPITPPSRGHFWFRRDASLEEVSRASGTRREPLFTWRPCCGWCLVADTRGAGTLSGLM